MASTKIESDYEYCDNYYKTEIKEEDQDPGFVYIDHYRHEIKEESQDPDFIDHEHCIIVMKEENEDPGFIDHEHYKSEIKEENQDPGVIYQGHYKHEIKEESQDPGFIDPEHYKSEIKEENQDQNKCAVTEENQETDLTKLDETESGIREENQDQDFINPDHRSSKPGSSFGSSDQQAEEDVGSIFCINDSSSDDDDLIHPDNTLDSGDHPPSSESGEDLQPPQFTPQPGPSAPPPTTWQKRGRSSQGTSSTPGKKSGKRFRSSEGKEEERWHDRDEEDIKPDVPKFIPARTPGPTFDTTKAWSPISLFQLFFSASVVRTIIENTNANAVKRKCAGMKFKWEVLMAKDFYTFLAIVIFTGLVTVQNRSDYWRKKWLYNFPFPSEKMTQDRFESIMWFLHLSNPEEDEENEKKRSTAEYDRLFKIKPLYTEMVDACKTHFQPYNNLSIDEQIVATKAQMSLKQYIKDKPTKWGYKIFVLRDTSIGYTWNFFVYTGKRESPKGHGLSYSAVMDLMSFPLLGTGYTLYTDNFYTSPTLCTDLSTKKIGCCGTIGKHRNGFPQTQTNDLPKKAERGDIRWIRSGKLLFVKWMGTREVTMCSTVHQAYSGQTVRRKVKEAGVWQNKSIPVPDCIVDYSQNMGRVDLSDAQIGFYRVHHKITKWYKALFYHFLDIAVVNSYLLHKELFEIKQDATQAKPLTHKAFREQLAKEMLVFAERPAATPPLTTCMPIFFDSEARKHCKRCKDAGTPRVKTAVYCRKCNVPLCLSSKRNCFQEWHDGQQRPPQ